MANELSNVRVSAAPAPAPEAPAAPEQPQLPPPVAAVANKEVPGIIVPPVAPNSAPDELQSFLIQNYTELPKIAPVDFFEAKDASTVVYNPEMLTEESLAKADTEGTLQQLLQPAEQAAPEAPAAPQPAEGTSLPAPTPNVPAMQAPKVPAGTQDALAKARVRNMQGGPKVSPIQPNPVGQQLSRRAV